MHSTHAGTGPATAAPRRIRADHLQLVLVAHRMGKHNTDLAQFAARSGYLPLINACRCGKRALTNFDARAAITPAYTPMWAGHIDNVFSRTQREHGAREVRRIWGRGVKTLLSEPAALRVRAQ